MSDSAQQEAQGELKEVNIGPRAVEIPTEWEAVRLGDEEYSEWITQGPNPDYSKGTPSTEYRAIKTKDLYDSGVLYDNADKISEETFENRNKYKLEQNDVLVAIVGRGSIGKTHIFQEHPEREYIFTRAIGLVRPNTDGLLPEYLHQYFQSHDAKEHFYQSITGSTGQEVLRTSAIKAMPIPLPPFSEQRRIADILSTIDKQIQQTDAIIEESKNLKRGLIQDLLTQGIDHNEFKQEQLGPTVRNIPQCWDIKRLDEISKVKRGASPRPIGDEKWFGGDVGWLRISDVSNSGKYVKKTEDYLSKEGQSESVRVYPGELILSIAATVGKPCILDIEACIHDGIVAFKNLSENIDVEFLYYTMLWERNRLISKGQTGTQANVNSSIVGRFKIHVPPLDEQKRIVSVLSKVDKKIQEEKTYREKLRQIKQGLTQDLLTGKVRVSAD